MPTLATSLPAIALEEVKRAHTRWWRTWFSVYLSLGLLLAAGSLFLTDPALQTALAVGAVGAGLGFVGTLLSPLGPRTWLRMGTLEDYAAWERNGRGLVHHVLGTAVVLGLSATLLLYFALPAYALINLVLGLLVHQAQLRTQPMGATRLFRQ